MAFFVLAFVVLAAIILLIISVIIASIISVIVMGYVFFEDWIKSRQKEDEALHDAIIDGMQRVSTSNAPTKNTKKLSMLDALKAGNNNELAAILKQGVHPVYSSAGGKNLLEVAVKMENIEAVKMLLTCGANPNSCSSFINNTPLHIAVKKKNCHLVELLLKAGADPSLQNLFGKTPYSLAVRKKVKTDDESLIAGLLNDSVIHVRCGSCNVLLKIPSRFNGTTGNCNHCGMMVSVPRI